MTNKVHNKCFVIMPFQGNMKRIYSEIYKPIIEECKLECVRADKLLGTRPIIEDIFKSITNSLLIIADMTGNNPNVCYELGIAMSLHKPIILVTGDSEEIIPFDIKHLRFIIYNKKSLKWKEILKSKIREYIIEIVGDKKKKSIELTGKIFNNIHEIQTRVDTITKRDCIYELNFVNWRLSSELKKLKGILNDKLEIPAKDKYSYLRYVFGSILNELSNKDIYRTLTTVHFWNDENIGTEDFLTSNLNALKAGAIIKRVLLINKTVLKTGDNNSLDLKKQLNKIIKNFELFKIEVLKEKKIKKKENYVLRFLLFENSKGHGDAMNLAPFAIITNENYNRSMSIGTKNIDTPNKDPSIMLNLFNESDNNLKHYIDNFEKMNGNAITLEELKRFLRNASTKKTK